MADVFNMTDTWNNGGTTFSAIKMDVTNSASAANSRLIDLLIGGASIFRVEKEREMFLWNTGDDINYERGSFKWNANVLQIGAEAAGSGTLRNCELLGADLIANPTNNIRLRVNGSQKIAADAATIYIENAFVSLSTSTRTIATGAIAVNAIQMIVDTEGAAATDDLDTITGGSGVSPLIVLRAASDARTVVVKNGTGNIFLSGSDMSLDNIRDTITLLGDGTNYHELCRSNNGA